MRFHVQYRPWCFRHFQQSVWLTAPRDANGAHLGICYSAIENLFFAWNKLFQVNKSFSKKYSSHEDFMAQICAHAGISKWTKISRGCLNNGTCGSTMEIPRTARHWLTKNNRSLEIYHNLENISRFSFTLFTRYKHSTNEFESLIDVHVTFAAHVATCTIMNIFKS